MTAVKSADIRTHLETEARRWRKRERVSLSSHRQCFNKKPHVSNARKPRPSEYGIHEGAAQY
eukprot:5866421-Karenia_brevis.AAC.1